MEVDVEFSYKQKGIIFNLLYNKIYLRITQKPEMRLFLSFIFKILKPLTWLLPAVWKILTPDRIKFAIHPDALFHVNHFDLAY